MTVTVGADVLVIVDESVPSEEVKVDGVVTKQDLVTIAVLAELFVVPPPIPKSNGRRR